MITICHFNHSDIKENLKALTENDEHNETLQLMTIQATNKKHRRGAKAFRRTNPKINKSSAERNKKGSKSKLPGWKKRDKNLKKHNRTKFRMAV